MPLELLAAANLLASQPSTDALDAHVGLHQTLFSQTIAAFRPAEVTQPDPGTNALPSVSLNSSNFAVSTPKFAQSDNEPHLPFDVSQTSNPVTVPSLNGQFIFNAGAASHREFRVSKGDFFVEAGGYQCLSTPGSLPLALEGQFGASRELAEFGSGMVIGSTSFGQTLTLDPRASQYAGRSMNFGLEYRTAHSGLDFTISSLVCGATGETSELIRASAHHDIIREFRLGCGLNLAATAVLNASSGAHGIYVTPQLQFQAGTDDGRLALVVNSGIQFGGHNLAALDRRESSDGGFVTLSFKATF